MPGHSLTLVHLLRFGSNPWKDFVIGLIEQALAQETGLLKSEASEQPNERETEQESR